MCVCVSGGESDGDSIEDLRVSSLEYSVSLSLSDELQLTVQHHIPPGHLHSVVETGHSYVCTSKITCAYYYIRIQVKHYNHQHEGSLVTKVVVMQNFPFVWLLH